MAKPAVGVIGVGAMGMGVARTLLAKGFEVFVRDLVDSREQDAQAAGAKRCATPRDLAARVQVVVTLVVTAEETRTVLFGPDGAAQALGRGSVVVMSSTIAPGDAEAITAQLTALGIPMLDAPISGGPARAHAGTLSIMAAGSDEAFARGEAVLAATSAKCFRVSARAGDGSRMKVVNNMLAASNLAAGCEAMALAAKLGLDLKQVRDVVNASSGQSWMFADRMGRALEGDYAPTAAARVLTKDIGLFVELARSLGLDPPMAKCAQAIFEDTVARGYGEEDDAAVLKRYAAAFGIVIPA